MNGQVLSRIVASPPPAGHRITFQRLDGSSSMTLAALHEAAGLLAGGLRKLGIGAGDRIGILAANCPQWVLLDLAALRLKAVTCGFEPGKFEPSASLASRYDLAVLFTDQPAAGAQVRPIADVSRLIRSTGPAAPLPAPRYRLRDVTTVKFTSGSTGEPKGLGATAGSIDSSISAVQRMFRHGSGDNIFVFLPLSLLQQRYWIYSALRFGHDVTVSTYEAAFAGLRNCGATVVMGVPAFYEAAYSHIEARARRAGDAAAGRPVPSAARRAAARELFGSRIRYLWTGSAPARPSMLRFFAGAGMPIYEGYGLNEACIVAKNHPGAHREGSVGQVLPGKKVLLDTDGLISVWSEHPVNWRYEYAAPGESERVFAPDGTVRTGDLGYFDEDGFLHIRGRADDVIVLGNGVNVVVRPIEEYLKACPAVHECVVLCAPGQSRLLAVVSPASDPPDTAAIRAQVASAGTVFGGHRKIGGLVIAPERFSTGNGMLTSQFKPRRQQIAQTYLPRGEVAGDGA